MAYHGDQPNTFELALRGDLQLIYAASRSRHVLAAGEDRRQMQAGASQAYLGHCLPIGAATPPLNQSREAHRCRDAVLAMWTTSAQIIRTFPAPATPPQNFSAADMTGLFVVVFFVLIGLLLTLRQIRKR
jgi:hypothetical protein